MQKIETKKSVLKHLWNLFENAVKISDKLSILKSIEKTSDNLPTTLWNVNEYGYEMSRLENIQKSDKLPEERLPKVVDDWGEEALSAQNITLDKSLWSLDMYEKFLEDRRQKIAGAINNLMNSLG